MAEGLVFAPLKLSEIEVPRWNAKDSVCSINDRGWGAFSVEATRTTEKAFRGAGMKAFECHIDAANRQLLVRFGDERNPDHLSITYASGKSQPLVNLNKVLFVLGMDVPAGTVMEVAVKPWDDEPRDAVVLDFAQPQFRKVSSREGDAPEATSGSHQTDA